MQVISVEVPKNLELEVTETAPGVKGNTVSGGTKSAKLETGAVIQVINHEQISRKKLHA